MCCATIDKEIFNLNDVEVKKNGNRLTYEANLQFSVTWPSMRLGKVSERI